MFRSLTGTQKADLFQMFMKVLTHILLACIFFLIMSFNNPQIIIPSRTMAVTILMYISMMLVMNVVYGGYTLGKRNDKSVISSLIIAAVITCAMTYLQLQIMNVNEDNKPYLILLGQDFLLLLAIICAQSFLIAGMVKLGNKLYYIIAPPSNCCVIIYKQNDITEAIIKKVKTYSRNYKINDIVVVGDADLSQVMERNETVFLCGIPTNERIEIILQCYRLRKTIAYLPELEDVIVSNAKQLVIDDALFLLIDNRTMTYTQRIIKRLMDISLSFIGLIISSPFLLLAAIAIKIYDGGHVLYKQERLTINAKQFTLIKLRTMSENAQGNNVKCGSARVSDQRITPVGRILRRFRLDEVPQLLNIIKGEMSIVGPRPEMIENIKTYKKEVPTFTYRERMKAGLTGYAQVEGKYNTSPQDKLVLDLVYIESFTIWLDIKIILRTLTVLFKKESTEGFSPSENQYS